MPADIQRVLMTADTIGGVWTFALELARALSADVHLATMGAPLREDQRREAGLVPNLTLHESTYKLEWMQDPWRDVDRAGDWLLDLESHLMPDVVHLNHLCHGALPWHAPVVVTGHSCVLSWWLSVTNEQAPAEWMEYRDRVSHSLYAARLVLAPTRWMAAELSRHYGVPFSRCLTIPNARDPRRFWRAAKEDIILSAGRLWDEGKNIQVLDQVAPDLAWPVYLAGDDCAPGGTQVHTPAVRTLGRLSPGELSEYFADAAIYAAPAKYEPFGLSVLEGALSGCALVLGDIPSLRENWQDAAEFVAPDDTDHLKSVLSALIADSSRRYQLAERAHARSRRFSTARMASAYLSAYEQARPLALCAY